MSDGGDRENESWDLDELDPEFREQWLKSGRRADRMPVTYRSGDGKVKLQTEFIRLPSGEEVQAYSDPRKRTCVECKFFDLHNGQREMQRQRFAERLVYDEKWKLRHLGAPLELVGLCGASGGEMATTAVSPQCDQFREKDTARRKAGGRWAI